MTYAISDVHGCLRSLRALLERIAPRAEDQLIFLGDYIDRGGDSRGVVELMLKLRQEHPHTIFLKGNHECILEDAYQSYEGRLLFMHPKVGGVDTLESYGVDQIEELPAEHLDFLFHQTVLYHETETHLFVHGGVDPLLPMESQSERTLIWKRFDNPVAHISGKTMICGHSIQGEDPSTIGNHSICIDTGSFTTWGYVTALAVETGHYVQANEGGEVREGDLSS